MQDEVLECPICKESTLALSTVQSAFSQIDFELRGCDSCGGSFVANPRVDFADLYDESYYAGRGADPFVDYIHEMNDRRTVREYEWRGIEKVVRQLTGRTDVKWLDYGCGLGGLVRFTREHGMHHVYGFDEGWSAEWMTEHDLPVLCRDDLQQHAGQFDVVTAIEVMEHVTDPVAMMNEIASLLRPGGIFLLTTGNAAPHRGRLASWSYVQPDVHVMYFEPRTLAEVYRRCGLESFEAGFVPGFEDIIRYKVLKTLRVRKQGVLERLVPWRLASRVVDWRHQVTAQPFARRPDGPVVAPLVDQDPSERRLLTP